MTSADRFTASRIILAPVFFIVFAWGESVVGILPTVILLWFVFAIAEASDLLDGGSARKHGTVSDYGKLFDPFADVMVRLTYFVCFSISGIMPAIFLIILLYRELAISFIRSIMAQQGVTLGARSGGKLKSLVYFVSITLTLIYYTLTKLGIWSASHGTFKIVLLVSYCAAAFFAIASFIDYLVQFRKHRKALSKSKEAPENFST